MKSGAWIGAQLTILCSIKENSEMVTINKLESVFCAQFEFGTQTKVNKSQTQ